MSEPHPAHEQLVALALDDLDPQDQWRLTGHLDRCERCRLDYGEIAAVVEGTLVAAPVVQPAPGFEQRVLSAMAAETPVRARWWRSTRWLTAAAALVLGVALGAGLTTAVRTGDSGPGAPPGTAVLTTSAGQRVGSVTPADLDGRSVLVVEVTGARPGMDYLCLVRLRNGHEVYAGRRTIPATGSEAWVVDAEPERVREVRLVASGGTGPVWSTATL